VTSRILVVDDSTGFCWTAGELLTEHGFELIGPAADGESAIAVARHACPDGVLLDINLPGRDGFSVAALLSSACPAARIVLTSADVGHVPPSALHGCGAAAFVPKIELAIAGLDQLFAS